MSGYIVRNEIVFFLTFAVLAYAMALVASLINKRAVLNKLRSDGLGWMMIVGSFVMAVAGWYVGGATYTFALVLGGFVFGLGFLTVLNEQWTIKVLSLRNVLAVVLVGVGLYLFIAYVVIAPFGDALAYAWKSVTARLSWDTVLVLLVSLLLVAAGLAIKGVRPHRRARVQTQHVVEEV